MLNDDEIVTYVQAKSDPVDDETEDKGRVFCVRDSYGVVRTTMRAVLLNYCYSSESETLQRKNEGTRGVYDDAPELGPCKNQQRTSPRNLGWRCGEAQFQKGLSGKKLRGGGKKNREVEDVRRGEKMEKRDKKGRERGRILEEKKLVSGKRICWR
ncbi:hypothetical protein TNCV_3605671 [Trichonephila clavipes]|uniref:Uncharacterized protein n=1 Tax=Trichonephila clavipes TaxID=2585209 RepID=A0A8X6RHH9_TRICX|nr:hypothetical protein TNCV_3605671 [Trichonephila clavipes]